MTAPRPAAARWAASGGMWLTGHPHGPPLSPATDVITALEGAAAQLRLLRPQLEVDVAQLLTGRAALLGLGRRGRTSANGSCRLLPAADGWIAVNLARPTDVASVGALVGRTVDGDPWDALARAAARLAGADLVERAALVGIPLAELPLSTPPPATAREPFTLRRFGDAREPGTLVVDLSALWAGPLCAHLLGRAGMRVVKVESTARPDGARSGHPGFFDWLHAGHASVALELGTVSGRDALAHLVAQADVVIESSRPRALRQLGLDAEAVVAARPGTTWVSITGYGRQDDGPGRVAFGDDAAVAAGLVAWDDEGAPVFCADAVADPITGLHAAVAALTSMAAGGGHLAEVVMVDAVASTWATPAPPTAATPTADGGWTVGDQQVLPPRLPPVRGTARPLGADTTTAMLATHP